MCEDKDIFDKIMEWPLMRPFQSFYKKYKEGLLYLFFGGLTVFLAIIVFAILHLFFGINELVANIISWVVGVTFSFFTNRKWVFQSGVSGIGGFISQMAIFYLARIATLLLQEALLYIFITRMCYPSIAVKISTEVINIILNYLASKLVIFRKKKCSKE